MAMTCASERKHRYHLSVPRFTSKQRDAESGLDYFGARYFSSAEGRFTSPDWSATPEPIPYADLKDPQTLNLYAYVRNNPLSHDDPDGHCCLEGLELAYDAARGFLKGTANRLLDNQAISAANGNPIAQALQTSFRFKASNPGEAVGLYEGYKYGETAVGLAMALGGPKGEFVSKDPRSGT